MSQTPALRGFAHRFADPSVRGNLGEITPADPISSVPLVSDDDVARTDGTGTRHCEDLGVSERVRSN
jgi:hypothetical protein